MEERRDLLRVPDRGAEDDRALILDIIEPGIDDELVPLRHADANVQIADIVLHAVEAHLRHIDVRMNADTAHVDKRADLHRPLNVQAVRRVLENFEDVGVVRAFGRRREAENKLRFEIGQDLLIGLRRGVVRLVDDDIVERVLFELVQIQSDALNAPADDLRIPLLDIICKLTDARLGPQRLKSLIRLTDELHRVRDEERSAADALCVQHGRDRLARARRLV